VKIGAVKIMLEFVKLGAVKIMLELRAYMDL
jgi:hypothetical protein